MAQRGTSCPALPRFPLHHTALPSAPTPRTPPRWDSGGWARPLWGGTGRVGSSQGDSDEHGKGPRVLLWGLERGKDTASPVDP